MLLGSVFLVCWVRASRDRVCLTTVVGPLNFGPEPGSSWSLCRQTDYSLHVSKVSYKISNHELNSWSCFNTPCLYSYIRFVEIKQKEENILQIAAKIHFKIKFVLKVDKDSCSDCIDQSRDYSIFQIIFLISIFRRLTLTPTPPKSHHCTQMFWITTSSCLLPGLPPTSIA